MKGDPRVRVNCPTHKSMIAAIYSPDVLSLEVVLWSQDPEGRLQQTPPFALNDERANRWMKTGAPMITWCKECGKEHSLAVQWLREIGEKPGKIVLCPCGVESSN